MDASSSSSSSSSSSPARRRPPPPTRAAVAAKKDRAPPPASPPSTVAGHAIYELSIDETFEFDGGSGFGATLASNRPLVASPPARNAVSLLQSPFAAATSPSAAAHKFTFTSASEYTSPKKIPVFPGTHGSPEKRKDASKRTKPPKSPRGTGAHSSSPYSKPRSFAAADTLAVATTDKPAKREASPRKFLRESLALSSSLGLSTGSDYDTATSDNHRNQDRLSVASPVQFVAHHDPLTQTHNIATADAAAEVAAAAAAGFLRTGEDAIAFFARSGAESAIKFVHLNRAPTGHLFRPYDLVVVPEQRDVATEHFTMSASGLVHVRRTAPGYCAVKRKRRL